MFKKSESGFGIIEVLFLILMVAVIIGLVIFAIAPLMACVAERISGQICYFPR